MSQLFEDSDEEIEFKTDNSYAKTYDIWRKKEEIHKATERHGAHALEIDEDDSDTSEDDEEAVKLTEDVEKDFFKTLALLKQNDPKIYDEKFVCFKKTDENVPTKAPKEKKMFYKDYERKLLLEKGVIASDSENEEDIPPVPFKRENDVDLNEFRVSDDENDEILKECDKDSKKEAQKEEDYKAWLIGQKDNIKDEEIASSLAPLKQFWTDKKLTEDEQFLRDFIVHKRYLEKEGDSYPTYDEVVADLSEDEEECNRQEKFEEKYNFRYEEPDQEFIKRYPRTIGGSLRREDNRRKIKRQEVKERKAQEKEEKMEDLRKLRDIKRKEIEEKIEKLKEITGNQEIAFNEEDLEGDFDPEEYDRKMQARFNDEYYENGPDEDIKPPIDLDDEDALELQPENFDNWTGVKEDEEEDVPHCEDEEFNMDADYDPKVTQKELVDNSKRRKKRKRKSKFVEMLAKERPKFDPMDKNYEKYVDEYYKYDCEDIIDDTPFKFKYRKVIPNNFGLSVEEILLANDRELNKWCSLKKAVSLREDHVEKYEQIAYEKKGQNINLKKKILPSLFVEEEKKSKSVKKEEGEEENDSKKEIKQEVEDVEEIKDTTNLNGENSEIAKKKRKKKGAAQKNITEDEAVSVKQEMTEIKEEKDQVEESDLKKEEKTSKKKNKKRKIENNVEENQESPEQNNECNEKPSKKKKKVLENNYNEDKETQQDKLTEELNISSNGNGVNPLKKKKKHKKQPESNEDKNTETQESTNNKNKVESNKNSEKASNNKRKHKKGQNNAEESTEVPKTGTKRKFSGKSDKRGQSKKSKKDIDIGISDSRIACFGWNPKKFKNKLIYGNKDQKK